jgi:hypothetical protein
MNTFCRAHDLSVELAVSRWMAKRRYRAEQFPLSDLAARKPVGLRVSVTIPTVKWGTS